MISVKTNNERGRVNSMNISSCLRSLSQFCYSHSPFSFLNPEIWLSKLFLVSLTDLVLQLDSEHSNSTCAEMMLSVHK